MNHRFNEKFEKRNTSTSGDCIKPLAEGLHHIIGRMGHGCSFLQAALNEEKGKRRI
jgi:hypothetical protein